uniref:RNA polymerase II subunit A C-terminal domain phosphatase SSU72 n=1 Tax=Xenorhabdus sp. Sc-CR9 TaxID=2584468 RepID=UPI001F4915A1
MAQSPAERKAAQRQRQRKSGVTKIELLLDNQELDMLKRNRALRRRPERECGDNLPVAESFFSGEVACWTTLGWHKVKL